MTVLTWKWIKKTRLDLCKKGRHHTKEKCIQKVNYVLQWILLLQYRIFSENAWIFEHIPFSDEVSFLLPKSWVLDDSDTHNSSQQETQCGETFLKEHSNFHGSVFSQSDYIHVRSCSNLSKIIHIGPKFFKLAYICSWVLEFSEGPEPKK